MSKSKDPQYLTNRLTSTKARKAVRKDKRRLKKEMYKRLRESCNCGEDPYCYCGDGTPYSY